MSIQVSSFVLSVQRRINDYSTYTSNLVYDLMNRRLDDMYSRFNWRDLHTTLDKTVASGLSSVQLSAHTDLVTENINTVKVGDKVLKNMSMPRYRELLAGQTMPTGDPENFVPFSSTLFYVYPSTSSSTVFTIDYKAKPVFLSAGSQYFALNDDKVRVLEEGVIADVYVFRGDDRASYFENLYQMGIKRLKGNERRGLNETGVRLLPGDSRE